MHINEFQDMMRRLYFHRDFDRGARGTYDWLVDETRELGEALEKGDKKELESEFADVIAWLASWPMLSTSIFKRPRWTSMPTYAQNVNVHPANVLSRKAQKAFLPRACDAATYTACRPSAQRSFRPQEASDGARRRHSASRPH